MNIYSNLYEETEGLNFNCGTGNWHWATQLNRSSTVNLSMSHYTPIHFRHDPTYQCGPRSCCITGRRTLSEATRCLGGSYICFYHLRRLRRICRLVDHNDYSWTSQRQGWTIATHCWLGCRSQQQILSASAASTNGPSLLPARQPGTVYLQIFAQ